MKMKRLQIHIIKRLEETNDLFDELKKSIAELKDLIIQQQRNSL